MVRLLAVALVVLLSAAACSGVDTATDAGQSSATTEDSAEETAPATAAPTSAPATPPTTAPPETPTTAVTTTLAPTTTTTTVPGPSCQRVTDFATAAEQQGWAVTLDGVMGGLSSGRVDFDDSVMTFTGEIVTDGGGFSLLRTPLGFDTFVPGTFLLVRARVDGRGYEMVFKDGLEGRRRQLFHEAQMPLVDSGDWQEVAVALSGLPSTSNGRPVDAEPFDKDVATEMGIILKDGVDGAFQIAIDWIDICTE